MIVHDPVLLDTLMKHLPQSVSPEFGVKSSDSAVSAIVQLTWRRRFRRTIVNQLLLQDVGRLFLERVKNGKVHGSSRKGVRCNPSATDQSRHWHEVST